MGGQKPICELKYSLLIHTLPERRLEEENVFIDGKINLSQAQAFTVSNDHEWQDKLLQEAKETNDFDENGYYEFDTDDIREALTEKKIPATDPRVRFVTVEAYEAAGGTVTNDLFVDEEEGIYIEDAKLLTDLANDKLDVLKKEIKAEGWSFVKVKAEHLNYPDYRESEPSGRR